jgi:large subunit ribosomal protein L18
MKITIKEKRIRRHARIRTTINGTALRPRLSVFKSNKYLYAQLIDDVTANTLLAVNSQNMKKGTALEKATEIGITIAKMALEKKITQAVFDRGGFRYTGKIQAIADGARTGGLTM